MTIEDVLQHLARRLHLSTSELDEVRLVHVRDGGREVEIYDGRSFSYLQHSIGKLDLVSDVVELNFGQNSTLKL